MPINAYVASIQSSEYIGTLEEIKELETQVNQLHLTLLEEKETRKAYLSRIGELENLLANRDKVIDYLKSRVCIQEHYIEELEQANEELEQRAQHSQRQECSCLQY